ncbi:MAG: hypothetical protein ACAH59_05540 [Pseudobdellovibrionaceae bacterium]
MSSSCVSCQNSKASLQCGICHQSLCKTCAEFLDEGHFSFLSPVPEELSQTTFCPQCFQEKIAPALLRYEEQKEKAKEILVFFKHQGKETRLISRKESLYKISSCPDRDETLLRLAFFAVGAGFNALIDVDLVSEKIRNGSRQHLIWHGSARPAHVDVSKLPKDRSLWQNPN